MGRSIRIVGGSALQHLVAAGFLLAVVLLFARLLTPGEGDALVRSPQELAELASLRDPGIADAGTVVRWQEVDYREGSAAPWWPRVDPEALRPLVESGELPPVHARTGPEPVVLSGGEGVPSYGGTWFRAALSLNDASIILYRMNTPNLVRWSPQGYPIVPHLARAFEISDDRREFTFYLRKGIHWSDGHPMTAADLLYWWEMEASHPQMRSSLPEIMRLGGDFGKMELIDEFTVKFVFPEPNGLFLEKLASFRGMEIVNTPAHYLGPYHPFEGDADRIGEEMTRRQMPSARALYRTLKEYHNPEHPRLWPWIYTREQRVPPYTAIRNPWYFGVDTEGRQLPYIDRIFFNQQSGDLIGISAGAGELSMQDRHLRFAQYTLLMSQRKANRYSVFHWLGGDSSDYVIQPNLNRKVEPDKPETAWKARLLADARFRQALSIGINRKDILRAEFAGLSHPAQVGPPQESPFHYPGVLEKWTQYDALEAGRILDGLGLDQRDADGFRTFPDGSPMQFFLSVTPMIGTGPAQLVAEDWRSLGIRVQVRERSRELFRLEIEGLIHDFSIWRSNGEFLPLLEPRLLVPLNAYSDYARAWGAWFAAGGFYGEPHTARSGHPPPAGHPVWESFALFDRLGRATDRDDQKKIVHRMLEIATDQLWTINLGTAPPFLTIVRDDFRNVPQKAVYSFDFMSPGNLSPEIFYLEGASSDPGIAAELAAGRSPQVQPGADSRPQTIPGSGARWGSILRSLLLAVFLLAVVLLAMRHPFIGRRMLLMVPTLFIVSVVNFIIIQAPPGDYLTTLINQLQESGDTADMQRVDDLKEIFHLEESVVTRYLRWSGIHWFATFNPEDKGLLQGNMGRSMETLETVNNVVGDRILLTLLISAGTILFTWAVAIPLGIYSAVKQYSAGDYIAGLIGFIGMCIPNFLLALILMYFSSRFLGITAIGLFSPEFAAQPGWSWDKFVDLLTHIWIPIIVVGTGGTAHMLRIMRGNLLDELKKPYVTTARAKGVRPLKLLLKYPVRMALNPFVSVLGNLFPQLVSGSAIVALILSLPTVGPLMLSSLLNQDMYLAGSMLMVLSLLGVAGTLLSDLLLVLIDPRIRLDQGTSR